MINDIATVITTGLALVAKLLGHGTPAAIEAAKAMIESLLAGSKGDLTPDQVLADLHSLEDKLAESDAKLLNDLHAKFDTPK